MSRVCLLLQHIIPNLKVVSVTFLLVFFMSKREHFWNKENVFYFTLKILFVLEIIRFLFFRYSNVMTSSNAKAVNTKHILLNYLGSKHSLLLKFGQFMYYYKRKFFIKKLYKKYCQQTSSRPFLIFKESSVKRNLRRSMCWFGQYLKILLIHI